MRVFTVKNPKIRSKSVFFGQNWGKNKKGR